jgi:hypothetical protein
MTDQPKKRGRPTVYDEEQVTEILHHLAEGESLRKICSEPDQHGNPMPSKGAFLAWVVDDTPPGLADRYARARIVRFEGYVDEAVETAEGRGPRSTGEWQRDRLVVDTIKWGGSHLLPAYKQRVEHSGNVGITIDQLLADTDE